MTCDICDRKAVWRDDFSAFCERHAPIAVARVQPGEPLTAREADFLRVYSQGLTIVETAEELGVSKRTGKRIAGHVRKKLSASTTKGAIMVAVREGYLELDEVDLHE